MLTRFVEKRRVKAHCYWPGNCGEQVTFGDISVKLLENFTDGSITMRQFLVSKGEEARNIFHVHYTEWYILLHLPSHEPMG
jgi:protein tyrosine phosphatase